VSSDDIGGDPACWLDRVCPECGAFRPDGTEDGCPRCAGDAEPHIPATRLPST